MGLIKNIQDSQEDKAGSSYYLERCVQVQHLRAI